MRAELARTIARCVAEMPAGAAVVGTLSKVEQEKCVAQMRSSSLFSFCPQAQLEAIVRQLSVESYKRLAYIIEMQEEHEQISKEISEKIAKEIRELEIRVGVGVEPVEVAKAAEPAAEEVDTAAVQAATAATVEVEAAAVAAALPGAMSIGALREAVCNGRTALVRRMLTEGEGRLGNIAQPVDKGPTPLHWAASHGHLEIARMLMEGTNSWAVITQQEDGKIPLHLAAVHRHSELVRALIEGAPSQVKASMLVGMRDGSKRTALFSACQVSGNAAVAAVLLEHAAACVDSGDGTGSCPLHLASMQGDAEMVRVLLGHSPEVDAIDGQGRTPLVCATIEGHLRVVQALLEAGASPKVPDTDGTDARAWAEMLEHEEISALF